MNLVGLWDSWDCFQISYIYVQLFPMKMSEVMLTIVLFFEAYCVFILIYIIVCVPIISALWGNHCQAGRSIQLWNCVPTKCACFLIHVTQRMI